jgi:hypothetical protein
VLLITLTFVMIQCVLAASNPARFVYFSLWVETIPYTWNWDTQLIYDTPVGPLALVAIQVFGFCLACLLVVATNLDKCLASARNYKWHLAFIAFCILSLSYAHSTIYGLRMIAKLLSPLLFMILIPAVTTSEDDLQKIRNAILGSGLLLLGLAIIARVLGIDADPNSLQTGMAGLGPPSMGPPVFSAHMLSVAMLALATYLCAPRTVNLLAVILCSAAVIAALQRTSAAALFVGAAVIMFFGSRGVWRILLPASGLVSLPLLIIFSDTFRKRMFLGATSSDQLLSDPLKAASGVNSSGRFDLWDVALDKFFRPHPAMGSGIGSTQDYLAHNSAGAGVVHSEYIRLLCEVGVIGLTLFVLAILTYLWRFRGYASKSNPASLRSAGLAAMGALVAYCLYCSTDNALDYVTQFGIYVFALMAVADKTREIAVQSPVESFESREASLLPFPNLLH